MTSAHPPNLRRTNQDSGTDVRVAAASGTFVIGGDLPVHRLGFGAMQLTGDGHWGPPADPNRAVRVLRAAVDHGVNHIDTADAYGPHVSETLIRRALWPYPADLIIATKGGMTRQGPNQWKPHGDPAYLRSCIDGSLERLGLDTIDLYYLHRIDPAVPLADQIGALVELQAAGKIRHIGISKVNRTQLVLARQHADIAAVQNRCNLTTPDNDVLEECEHTQIAYVPFAPLGAGTLVGRSSAEDQDGTATPAQQAIIWLLRRSPVILPIPGTSSPEHLLENLSASRLATDQRPNRCQQ